jgi:hypothetical protein
MEIIGFPDYLIYEDGSVFSKKSNIFMQQNKDNKGYLFVGLRNRGKKPIFPRIHRLIAIHFIPNPENKPDVDHINRIRDDDRIENLRWATKQENQENRGMNKNNTSGFKNINWHKSKKRWKFRVRGRNKIERNFKTKTDALCYKFYYILKVNYNKGNI